MLEKKILYFKIGSFLVKLGRPRVFLRNVHHYINRKAILDDDIPRETKQLLNDYYKDDLGLLRACLLDTNISNFPEWVG